jgi:hypothetical protein
MHFEVLRVILIGVVNLHLCLTKHYAMVTYGGGDVQTHVPGCIDFDASWERVVSFTS